MDRLQAMGVFRAVVEEGSFAGAARRLRLSNGAVSKAVAGLEACLETQLLHRTTRSLRLSSSGEAYYRRAAELLDGFEALERETRERDAQPRGLLRVAVPMSFGLAHIAPLVPGFLEHHPEVELQLELTDRMVDVVDEGFDLGIRVAARLADSSLRARRLGPFQRVVCARPDLAEAAGADPCALERLPCIRYLRLRDPQRWTLFRGEARLDLKVGGRFSADNSLAMRDALLGGAGYALIPRLVVASDLEAGRLQVCFPEWKPEDRSVFAIVPGSRRGLPKVQAFLDVLETALGGSTV